MVSIVIPIFNEEDTIPELYNRIKKVIDSINDSTEVIFIDDGCSDNSFKMLEEINRNNNRMKILRFSRNFGHQVAITAGIYHAKGDAVVIIDGDLQDPPELILDMLKLWKDGYQIIYGKRKQRKRETTFKLFTAKAFYKLINMLSEIKIPFDTGDFRLMDRKAVDALNSMSEQYRFVRGMVSWVGFKQKEYLYDRDARYAGQTKYPFKKMFRLALNAIFSFSTIPLKVATWLGIIVSLFSLLGILYVVALRVFTDSLVPGWTALFTAILFIGGIQLFTLGIIGEYIGRIYGEVKKRPLYIIQDKLGF